MMNFLNSRRALGCLILGILIVTAFTARSSTTTHGSTSIAPTAPMPTTPPSSTSAPAPAALPKVGERVEAANVVLTVNSVNRVDALDRYINKAEAGTEYVVVDVLLENTWTKDEPYNPLYFTVKDGTGVESGPTLHMEQGTLMSGKLMPGDKVKGTVAFKVAKGASGLTLTYNPLVLLGGYVPIRIALTSD